MASSAERIHIRGNSWYLPGSVNLGLYGEPSRTILMDSGNDESRGRKIFRMLEEEKRTLAMILNTHSHADHIGGNAYLQKKTGCIVGATVPERPFVEHPISESFFLWGAAPFKALQNKFLMASPSEVSLEIPLEGPLGDTGLTAVPLEGHSLGMVGFRTPDDVLYLGDSLFSPEIIGKYRLLFALDIRKWFSTLEQLRTLKAAFFVPCHAEPGEDILPLIEVNRRGLEELVRDVEGLCGQLRSRDELLRELFRGYGLTMTPSQYVLGNTTLSACLTYLMEEERVEAVVEDALLCWQKR